MRAQGGNQTASPTGTRTGNQTPTTAAANGGLRGAPSDDRQRQQPQLQVGDERGLTGQRARSGLVFVAKGRTYEPRVVMLGAANFDYTEIISGLEEGEEVALLAAVSIQAQRQMQTDRFRQNMGGGVPGMSSNQRAGGTRGPGGR